MGDTLGNTWIKLHPCERTGCTELCYEDDTYCIRCEEEQSLRNRLTIRADETAPVRIRWGFLLTWLGILAGLGYAWYLLIWFVGCLMGWWPMPSVPVNAMMGS